MKKVDYMELQTDERYCIDSCQRQPPLSPSNPVPRFYTKKLTWSTNKMTHRYVVIAIVQVICLRYLYEPCSVTRGLDAFAKRIDPCQSAQSAQADMG